MTCPHLAALLALVPFLPSFARPSFARAPQDGGQPLAQSGTPPDIELLRDAERQVRRQRYARAIELYAKLAEDYPDTPAGRTAAERSRSSAYLGWTDVLRHGPSSNRVDVVLMGDGFGASDIDQRTFDDLADGVPKRFAENRVLGEYLTYHNFVRVSLKSRDTRAAAPGETLETALGSTLTGNVPEEVRVDRSRTWEYLGELPDHDNVVLAWVRHAASGSSWDGLACIGTAWQGWSVHFWAHAFAGLGDEAAGWSHLLATEQPRPNVSRDRRERMVPWKHWIEAGVEGIGVFEGAEGEREGIFRPARRCAQSGGQSFCAVCREALVLEIYRLVDPIDACTPAPLDAAAQRPIAADTPVDLNVRVLQPRTHALEVRWWVLPDDGAPYGGAPAADDRVWTDRRARRRLAPIPRSPVALSVADDNGRHAFRFDPAAWDAGLYRVVCRVRDTTLVPGTKEPWVLLDQRGLLESERVWWLRVP